MIYLDNAATTPMDPRVVQAMETSMREDFANSGTVYKIGLDASEKIEECRQTISELLCLPSSHRIVFTSGGSESNNLFLKGYSFPGKRVACSGLEHPSVLDTVDWLNDTDEAIDLKPFQKEGVFQPSGIRVLKENKVRLFCLSHVNNEIGSINNPSHWIPDLNKTGPQTKLFLDGVQGVGKLPITANTWNGISGYSVSAHKINGPKGIGVLIYDSRLDLTPQIHGGKQQYGVRSGTLPVPLIVGFTSALKLALERRNEFENRAKELNACLVNGLKDLERENPELQLTFNTPVELDFSQRSPYIVNFSFPPVEGEVLLHHLEQKGIYVGLGSACSAHSREPSRILTGIGRSKQEARCSLRISFGAQNKLEEVEMFLTEFKTAYEALYPTFRQGTLTK